MAIDVHELEAARAAGLRYMSDAAPGIRRVARGGSFHYVDVAGKTIKDEDTLARLRAIAVPPAWIHVWISASPNGHLQATGRDARGRKQYRYHSRWRKLRDEKKFGRMVDFGKALPALRKRALEDMKLPGLPREKVVATVVWLLDKTLIRVGNDEYARDNGSYGLTTLRSKHVDLSGSSLRFEFKGKSGKMHTVDVRDPRAVRIVRRCRELPGYELFQYVEENGERRTVGSEDVNDYLRETTGEDFTAKEFRTWAGTVMCAAALARCGAGGSATESKQNLTDAVRAVASMLGNTPAVCRSSYIHPIVMEAYADGTFEHRWQMHATRARSEYRLRPEEAATLAFLKRRRARKAA